VSDRYHDGTITCHDDRVDLRGYYAPFGTKTIPYAQIKGLQRFEITGIMTGRWRLWGTGNPRYWANLDVNRWKKKVGFVIDLGRAVSPIVTPDDPDAFESVIRGRANLEAGTSRRFTGPFI